MYCGLLPVLTVLGFIYAINGTRNNIALKKPANQSKTLNYNGYDWNADFATDGNTGFKLSCRCCSGTDHINPSWWEVDLGEEHNIGKIDVYGRNDGNTGQLLGFSLYISNISQSTSQLIYQDYTTGAQYNLTRGHYTILVNQVRGRYVRITLEQVTLVICELQVFEACPEGHHEPDCDPCSCGGKPCNKTDGTCLECPAGTYGDHCSPCGHCLHGNTACDKGTGQCSGGCAAGYTGSTCDRDADLLPKIRPHLTVSMSTPVYISMNASLAIDGSYGTLPDTCHCCSVTTAAQSWWRLELGQMYPIRGVKLIGRSDQANIDKQNGNYTLLLSNTSFPGEGFQDEHPVGFNNRYVFYWNLSDIVASTITIKRANLLVICELKVYEGDCRVGYYNTSCDDECHCVDNKPCNRTSGTCYTLGCKPGWRGQACNEECLSPHFGSGCSRTCHCINRSHCDHVDGTCDRKHCEAGWRGSSCDTECASPSFGPNCSHTCHCKDGSHCHHVDGTCDQGECDFGWKGSSCDTECMSPSFGRNCSHICHCINNSSCNHRNGTCEQGLCEPGWQGSSCDRECVSPSFGLNCSHTCHCKDGSRCDHVDGTCDQGECDPGWQGSSCDTGCGSPFLGRNCSHICHCINNSGCKHRNGTCDLGLCEHGWQGSSCDTECISPSFGPNCSHNCHCKDGSHCDHVDGTCDQGECEPGWRGSSCDTGCVSPSFGPNCSHTCHCKDGNHCDHVDGTCDQGECEPGWRGSSCDTECASPSFGPKCSQTCHCIYDSHCDHVVGTCDLGLCDPGWNGSSCDQENQDMPVLSQTLCQECPENIGIIITVVVLAVTCVAESTYIIGLWTKRWRRRHKSNKAGEDKPAQDNSYANEMAEIGTSGQEVPRIQVNTSKSVVNVDGVSVDVHLEYQELCYKGNTEEAYSRLFTDNKPLQNVTPDSIGGNVYTNLTNRFK